MPAGWQQTPAPPGRLVLPSRPWSARVKGTARTSPLCARAPGYNPHCLPACHTDVPRDNLVPSKERPQGHYATPPGRTPLQQHLDYFDVNKVRRVSKQEAGGGVGEMCAACLASDNNAPCIACCSLPLPPPMAGVRITCTGWVSVRLAAPLSTHAAPMLSAIKTHCAIACILCAPAAASWRSRQCAKQTALLLLLLLLQCDHALGDVSG